MEGRVLCATAACMATRCDHVVDVMVSTAEWANLGYSIKWRLPAYTSCSVFRHSLEVLGRLQRPCTLLLISKGHATLQVMSQSQASEPGSPKCENINDPSLCTRTKVEACLRPDFIILHLGSEPNSLRIRQA